MGDFLTGFPQLLRAQPGGVGVECRSCPRRFGRDSPPRVTVAVSLISSAKKGPTQNARAGGRVGPARRTVTLREVRASASSESAPILTACLGSRTASNPIPGDTRFPRSIAIAKDTQSRKRHFVMTPPNTRRCLEQQMFWSPVLCSCRTQVRLPNRLCSPFDIAPGY